MQVKQRDFSDCGAACLASVAAFYKLRLPVARIRQYAGTDDKGTTLTGLIEASEKCGFETKGVRGTSESLAKIPLPAIAHLILANGLHHFVVVSKVRRKIKIMDPSDGKFHLRSLQDFEKEWTGVLVLMMPGQEFVKGNEQVSTAVKFWSLIRPHKSILAQALFGALIYTILGLSVSFFVQKITDNVLADGDRALLNIMGVIMIFILIIQVFIGTLKSIFTMRTGQQIDARLIMGYYRHLLKLPQQFFDTMKVGEIISRVNDAVKIRIFINDVSVGLAVNLFVVVFSFILMFIFYWKLALLMLLVIPIYGFIYYITNKLNARVQRKLMEESAILESQFVESLNAAGTIKRFGLENFTLERIESGFFPVLRTVYRSGLNTLFSGGSSEFVSLFFTIILLWAGSGYVLDGHLTPGELFSFYTLTGYFTGPAASLIGSNKMVQDAVIASERLFEIMDLEIESDQLTVGSGQEFSGDIRFEHVYFRYGKRALIFEDLNLHIERGRLTAIVGESGSGKSTIASLLHKIYPLQMGRILVGNNSLENASNDSLRKHICIVPQQIDLFSGNMIENIALGDQNPDIQRINDIISRLSLREFIEQLPSGLQTKLGERGCTLSGGQKQRIAIARALYREPPVLILDEATSSLDSLSEFYVQQVIQRLRDEEKTIIVIAHRLTSVCNADKIIVLEKGKVAEEGKHEDLLSMQGLYSRLWNRQFLPQQSV